MNYAPLIPLKRSNKDGYEMLTDIKDVVRFHLKNLLLTSPGEKISDPSYGVGLRRFLFEPMTGTTYGIIQDNINVQISVYLPYLQILELSLTPDDIVSSINVKIKYEVPNQNTTDVLNIDIDANSNAGGSYF